MEPTRVEQPHVLREYAFVADGERGALIGPRGDIAWLCAPRWDSAPVFDTLLGGTSVYSVTPDERFVWGGYYDAGSLIWNSRWVTGSTVIECRDALAFPSDEHRVVVLRRLRALHGEARVLVELNPVHDYGRAPLRDVRRADEAWEAWCGRLRLRWSGAADAVFDEDPRCPGWRLLVRGACAARRTSGPGARTVGHRIAGFPAG
ncbi:trehalase-like domain-containing protein [Nocardia tengchongensis]